MMLNEEPHARLLRMYQFTLSASFYGYILWLHSMASIADYDGRMQSATSAKSVTDSLRRLAAAHALLCKSFGWLFKNC